MDPASAAPELPEMTAGRYRLIGIWFGLAAFVLAVTLLFGGKPAWRAYKKWRAQHLASASLAEMNQGHWDQAARSLFDANALASDEPAVLRAMSVFLTRTKGDSRLLLQTLHRLYESGVATLEDKTSYGTSLASTGDIPGARKVWEDLPPQERESRLALELLSRIQREQGQTAESEATLRRALLSEPDNPECAFRLALLDLSNPFSEIKASARSRLWALAGESDDRAANGAIAFLAGDKELGRVESRQLLELLERRPNPPASLRFRVLSALIRTHPEEREPILEREFQRCRDQGGDQLADVLKWLAEEKEYGRMLQLAPESVAARSGEVFPLMLLALSKQERWREIRTLLTTQRNLPVSKARAALWLAECESHLQPDLAQTRMYLIRALESADKAREQEVIRNTAALAEGKGLWEVASRGYRMLAELGPQSQVPMLEKVYEVSSRSRDGEAMLETAREIQELRPASEVYAGRVAYLRLVLGKEMELAADYLLGRTRGAVTVEGAGSGDADRSRSFLRAFAAFRFGDRHGVGSFLSGVAQPEMLEPGQRAVFAGLLQATGRSAEAFQLAEGVPRQLLLKEELALLESATTDPALR